MNNSERFADRLMSAVDQYGPLCVGIDPHFGKIPQLFGPEGPESIASWGQAIVHRCTGKVAMIKPQIAFFERWGSKGIAALETVCQTAHEAGLLIMLDAKRGDIGSTAVGYAEAYLSSEAAAYCDAITINPYMGLDTLEPFIDACERYDKGIAVLARTSNPGSADFQTRELEGAPLFIRVAEALTPLSKRLQGKNTHWSGLMLVAGATGPEEAKALRSAAPDCPFLVPGYGAQGAGAKDAIACFVEEQGHLRGGLINASRGATMPEAAQTANTIAAWEQAIDKAILEAQTDLKHALLSE